MVTYKSRGRSTRTGLLHLHLLKKRSAASHQGDEERGRRGHETAETPDMLFSLETVRRQEALMKMLGFPLGVTVTDRMGTENIRGTADVGCSGATAREARLRWLEQVQRRTANMSGRRMLRMELTGRRPRGRPERRYLDVVKDEEKSVRCRGG